MNGPTTNGKEDWLARISNTTIKAMNIDDGRNRIIDEHQNSTGTSADRRKLFVINRLDGEHLTISKNTDTIHLSDTSKGRSRT